MDILIDSINYVLQGILLVVLLGAATKRIQFKTKYITEILVVTQYVAVQIILHYWSWVQRLFYGESASLSSSRQSILPLLTGIGITFLICCFLLNENKWNLMYYIITFFSLKELVLFTLYAVSLRLLDVLVQINIYFFAEQQLYDVDYYNLINNATIVIWKIILDVISLLILYYIVRKIKKYLSLEEINQKSQICFLMLSNVIGLLLCLMLRSLMFSQKESETYQLLDTHPELNLMIPCIAILCLISIVISAKMLRNLLEENKKKIEASIYQNRIKEMEQHMKDIESLYDGIRGMKHDMKNYIADMDALMEQNQQEDNASLRQYLGSLQKSVEQLDMKYKTGNPITDVIIQRYVNVSKKNEIEFESDFIFPTGLNIDAFDLSIILNNGLENAAEACKKLVKEKRKIQLIAYQRENMFFIIIRNSFDGKVCRANGRIITSKPDKNNHGFGIQNIEVCAEKYFGKTESKKEDGVFELAVMLQGRN